MTLSFKLDETKTPRVLTATSDRGDGELKWAGEVAEVIFVPTFDAAGWKLISNDGTTAVFNG